MGELPSIRERLGTFSLSVPRLSLREGEIFGVFGRSGSGKSSYLKALARVLGESRTELLPQDDDTLAALTVEQNVLLGALGRAQSDSLGPGLLTAFHLSPLSRRPAASLSGGQRRRVAIARVIAAEPELLLLDEPFNGLGRLYESIVIAELQRRSQAGLCTVVVSHDLQLLLTIASRVAVLHDGEALDILSDGIPQHGWTRLVGEIIGIPNVLPVRALRAVGILIGADDCPDDCVILAWRNWTSIDSSGDLPLRFEFPATSVRREISFRTEGATYMHMTLAGPGDPIEITGLMSGSHRLVGPRRTIGFLDSIITNTHSLHSGLDRPK